MNSVLPADPEAPSHAETEPTTRPLRPRRLEYSRRLARLGALLELLLIIANIGTAVVIFPIVRRMSEELALGYVTARLVECRFILSGILCMLGIITLRNQVAGPAEGTVAYTLAAIKDWTVPLRPGWVVGWGNGLILGYLMYRSGRVPRRAA